MKQASTAIRQSISIAAELRTPIAVAQIARYAFQDPTDEIMLSNDVYRLDMSVSGRPPNARASYCERWRPGRYERLGGVYMVPPGETVRFRSEAGDTTSVVCELYSASVENWIGERVDWTVSALRSGLDLPGARTRTLLRLLGEELRQPGFAAETVAELISGQLAIELSRHWQNGSSTGTPSGLPAWRLRIIDERVSQAGRAPSLSEIAELCDLSTRQLTRGFRSSRGCSIGAFVNERRAEQAKKLLHSDRSIKTIAREMNFGSPASFAYAFRKATGYTPRAFRSQLLRM